MIKPTLLEQLLLLRRRKGWTQDDLAKRLDVAGRTYRAWEDGTREPKPIVQKAIKQFLKENS